MDVLTKRPIGHDEAREAMQRLVNSHFNNDREKHEHGRMSIPANPDRDDDLVLSAYIKQQREAAELHAITETGYQQICLKNDALQALVGKMTDAMLASGTEQGRLRAALQRLLDWNEGIAAGRGNHYPREHADVARAALIPVTA